MQNRQAALPRGHKLYTSPATLKRPPWRADNDNYDSRGHTVTRPGPSEDWATYTPQRTKKPIVVDEKADWEVWSGSRFAPANDNNPDRRWKGEPNHGPDADYLARKANPGASRNYEGDILSRLIGEKDFEAAFVLRSIGQLLTSAGMDAANDNGAQDADVEMSDDGFGLDYAMEQPKAEEVIKQYDEISKIPSDHFKYRQRSGAGGCKLTAAHRKAEREGHHAWRYLSLRGVAGLAPQLYHSDGAPPWRSHTPKNAAAARELATACDQTDWRKVTWIQYPPMPARVYGDLSIFTKAKGTGEGGTAAPEHNVVHEMRRGNAEKKFRERMSERSLRLIDAAIARASYTEIAAAEGMSRSGTKKAIKAALKEAWEVITSITGEKMPEAKEKIAA